MKNLIKIISIFIITFMLLWTYGVSAWIDWLNNVQWINKITEHSITDVPGNTDISDNIEIVWFKILTIIKYIVSWILVIFLVYVGIQMIMSMWTDEDKLSSSKKQLRYAILWLVFINIPWTLYNSFVSDKWQIDGSIHWTWSSQISQQNENVLINTELFSDTLNWGIVSFIEMAIFTIAIFMITIAGIKILTSRWREEQITESKNKIVWSIIGLIFIWFIESWQALVYNGRIKDWANLFQTMEELALFFAWPVAIFFLTLAWYYYITSNGDEERVKKAKSIIINTVIATVILLASHAFLKDLLSLNI